MNLANRRTLSNFTRDHAPHIPPARYHDLDAADKRYLAQWQADDDLPIGRVLILACTLGWLGYLGWMLWLAVTI